MFRAIVVLLLIAAWIAPAAAEDGRGASQARAFAPVASEPSPKIESRLRRLIAEYEAEGFTRQNARARGAERRFSSARVKVDDAGRVQVYVTVAEVGDAALDVLRRHDLDIEIVNADFRTVQGWIPIDRLAALAAEPVVLKVRAPSYGRPRTGSVDTQGDAVHRCDAVRAQGVTGLGITVGVISAGVSGLASAIASGNLPSDPNIVVGRQDFANDEGTAMLEIAHDCAPGATLRFSSFHGTSLGFIDAVHQLQGAGASVIVDDVGFYDEPFFEDGPVAQNDRRIGDAVLRVSAAGNDAGAHYQGVFSPGVFDADVPRPGTRHDFGGGATLLRFRVAGQSVAAIVLQWADPFGAASDDYDWCVRSTSGAVVTCAANAQQGGDDPIEAEDVPCALPAGRVCSFDLQITRVSGMARALEVFCLGACVFDQFRTVGDSIFGHPAVPEVVAVAAASAAAPTIIEAFSSAGPSTILFPTAEVRSKPDVTGVDCVATSRPSGALNPFCGTSAAAPHVAGVAALLMQALGPLATMASVRDVLRATADDVPPAGPDTDFGAGVANALAAVQLVRSGPRIALDLEINRHSVSPGELLQATLTQANPGGPGIADVYFAVVVPPALSAKLGCPAGDGVVFLAGGGATVSVVCVDSASPSTFPPLHRGVFSPAAMPPATDASVFSMPWPAGIPGGTYTFAVFTTPPAAFADGRLDPEDITAVALQSFTASSE